VTEAAADGLRSALGIELDRNAGNARRA
jgi:hypothetical protein